MGNITKEQCAHKHTAYQPPEDEWRCPSCGAGIGTFHVDNDIAVSDDESRCDDLLHENDEVICSGCRFGTNGKNFAGRLQRMHSLVKCECCRGTGLVAKDKVTVGSFETAIAIAKQNSPPPRRRRSPPKK